MSQDVKIHIGTTADTSGAVATEKAIKRVESATSDATPTLDKLPQVVEKSGVQMKSMSILANQASFQLGDFFTQVQMGTGMVRAFSQQAPQMIGALQMAGMVTGGWGLALAGVAAAIPMVGMAVESLTKDTDEAGKSMGELSERMAKADVSRLDQAKQSMEFTLSTVRLLNDEFPKLEQASLKAASAVAADSKTIADSQEIINVLLDKQVNAYEQIEAASKREAASRRTAMEEQLKAQRTQAEEAFKAQKEAAEKYEVLQADIARREEAAAKKRDALLQARSEMKAAEQRLKEWQGRPADAPTTFGAVQSYEQRPEIPDGLADRISQLEASLNDLADGIMKKSAPGGELDQAKLKLQTATKNATDIQMSVEKVTEQLENSAKKTENYERLRTVADQSEQQAKDVLALLDKIEARDLQAGQVVKQRHVATDNAATIAMAAEEAQRAALENLRKLAADGEITAKDTAALGANLSKLVGGVQSGMTTFNGNIETLYATVNQIERNQRDLSNKLRNLDERSKRK